MNAALEAQIRAARPDESSWVSANAGSGKTRVLTDRVARLLLSGTDPQKILCLTYTKAAAAEMQNRLFRTLGAWAMLDDMPLRAALRDLGEYDEAMPVADLDRARTLFARALETPGGLKIQTIHAFCDTLLRRFPLEAGVAPQFSVLEDRQARDLREEALDELAERSPETFGPMALSLSGDDPDPLLREIIHNRSAFIDEFDRERLADLLGVSGSLTSRAIHDEVMAPGTIECLRAFVPILATSGSNDRKLGIALTGVCAAETPDAILRMLEQALLTGGTAKEPFTAKAGSIPTKNIRAAHPDLSQALDALMVRVEAARPRRLGVAALSKSIALNNFARAFLAGYDMRKRAFGRLDFDDLIQRARRLLERPETAAWVLFRLDGGLDHILVDEAQDTSPSQWRVIEAISAEFFSGLGARDVTRTIFVVGDEKQSIYSFQGADPVAFGGMRASYETLLADMGAELQRCDLLYSFRSSPPILALVDAVFAGEGGAGLAGDVTHHAFAPDRPGRVELWPFLPKPDRAVEPPWDEPLDALAPDDPTAILAGRIAETIAGWLADNRELPGSDRQIRAGDVLILVQRRGELFDAVIRALKKARVPVAGADLLRVGAELAVKDLLAALRFAATPEDDLSLAAFLRGPVGGLSEDELFQLAHGRGKASLWSRLRAEPVERWTGGRALLSDMLSQADYLRPFELLSRMLIRHDARRRLIARLGMEAEDGIDALLDQALAYESVEAPSLTGFLDWIDRDEMKVKRRLDDGADQVRVMTVHGAKGLEAPIVILPDTSQRREGGSPPQILPLDGDLAGWRPRADAMPDAFLEAEQMRRDLARAENRRLLYVALTRARTWLIVCGAGMAPGANSESWHSLVEAALRELDSEEEPGNEDPVLVMNQGWTNRPATAAGTAVAFEPVLPDWARRAPPALPPERVTLSPSALGGGHVLPGEAPADGEAAALQRGEAIHRLLETLTLLPESDWPAFAQRLLPGQPDLDELLNEAAAVLRNPDLAAIFAAGTLSEVDLTASLPQLDGASLYGRIDRLVVAEDHVLAVDFKSNRGVPDTAGAVPEGILRQMGAYHAALSEIWPGRRIDTAILWTNTGRLMPLPVPMIQAAFLRAADLDRRGEAP